MSEHDDIKDLIAQSSLGTPEAMAMRARTPPGLAYAISRAAEEMRRADEAEAERDRLQAELNTANAELEDAHRFERDARQVEAELGRLRADIAVQTDAADAAAEAVGAMAEKLSALLAERDRLRAVVDAAREFGVAHDAWHARIERGENVRSTDEDSVRRAAAMLELTDLVRQLDVSPTMGDRHSAHCGLCGRVSTDWEDAPSIEGGQTVDPWCQPCLMAWDRGRVVGARNARIAAANSGPSVGDRATCRWCHRPITFTSSSKLATAGDAWTHDGSQPGSGHTVRRGCEADMQSMVAEPNTGGEE